MKAKYDRQKPNKPPNGIFNSIFVGEAGRKRRKTKTKTKKNYDRITMKLMRKEICQKKIKMKIILIFRGQKSQYFTENKKKKRKNNEIKFKKKNHFCIGILNAPPS